MVDTNNPFINNIALIASGQAGEFYQVGYAEFNELGASGYAKPAALCFQQIAIEARQIKKRLMNESPNGLPCNGVNAARVTAVGMSLLLLCVTGFSAKLVSDLPGVLFDRDNTQKTFAFLGVVALGTIGLGGIAVCGLTMRSKHRVFKRQFNETTLLTSNHSPQAATNRLGALLEPLGHGVRVDDPATARSCLRVLNRLIDFCEVAKKYCDATSSGAASFNQSSRLLSSTHQMGKMLKVGALKKFLCGIVGDHAVGLSKPPSSMSTYPV